MVAIWQKNRQQALWQNWELMLATKFGNLCKMVTKFGSQFLATKFGFVPDCLLSMWLLNYAGIKVKIVKGATAVEQTGMIKIQH